jgi:hypothetical protein
MDSSAVSVFAQVDAGILVAALIETRGAFLDLKGEAATRTADAQESKSFENRVRGTREAMYGIALLGLSICICMDAVSRDVGISGIAQTIVLFGTVMGVWTVAFTPIVKLLHAIDSFLPKNPAETYEGWSQLSRKGKFMEMLELYGDRFVPTVFVGICAIASALYISHSVQL